MTRGTPASQSRARVLERLKRRYNVNRSDLPPTPPPPDLRQRLGAAITRTLATDPERIVALLETRAGAQFGRQR